MRCAAVDVGTNTVRLLIADLNGDAFEQIIRRETITRLGQGVDAHAGFHPDALGRTIAAVAGFVAEARDCGADHVRVVATSAVRSVVDPSPFTDGVRLATGLEVEILSGADEGRAAHTGATYGLPEGDWCVIDIGGGSTEFSRADGAASFEVGSVRVCERPGFRIEFPSLVPLQDGERLAGVAGTVTTLAMIDAGVREWRRGCVHRRELNLDTVIAIEGRLSAMSADEIVGLGVPPMRADVLPAGATILRAGMEALGAETLTVSETDLLDGLILGRR